MNTKEKRLLAIIGAATAVVLLVVAYMQGSQGTPNSYPQCWAGQVRLYSTLSNYGQQNLNSLRSTTVQFELIEWIHGLGQVAEAAVGGTLYITTPQDYCTVALTHEINNMTHSVWRSDSWTFPGSGVNGWLVFRFLLTFQNGTQWNPIFVGYLGSRPATSWTG